LIHLSSNFFHIHLFLLLSSWKDPICFAIDPVFGFHLFSNFLAIYLLVFSKGDLTVLLLICFGFICFQLFIHSFRAKFSAFIHGYWSVLIHLFSTFRVSSIRFRLFLLDPSVLPLICFLDPSVFFNLQVSSIHFHYFSNGIHLFCYWIRLFICFQPSGFHPSVFSYFHETHPCYIRFWIYPLTFLLHSSVSHS
jgi:hypothetical protein